MRLFDEAGARNQVVSFSIYALVKFDLIPFALAMEDGTKVGVDAIAVLKVDVVARL